MSDELTKPDPIGDLVRRGPGRPPKAVNQPEDAPKPPRKAHDGHVEVKLLRDYFPEEDVRKLAGDVVHVAVHEGRRLVDAGVAKPVIGWLEDV